MAKCLNIENVILSLLLVAFLALPTWGFVPDEMNFQGKLMDADDNPLNGLYDMNFSLYTTSMGGTLLWSETQTNVSVVGGIYTVQLGAVSPLVPDDFANNEAWLEVEIEGELMSPRLPVNSVGFAFRAAEADNAETLEGAIATDFAAATHNHDSLYVNEGQDNAITSVMIADGVVTAADLGSNSVTISKIATGAVTGAQVADNSLSAADLAANSVTASEIATGAVGSSEILDGSITSIDFADGAALAEMLDDDGAGSGLDADLVDGKQAYEFAAATHDHVGVAWSANIAWSQGAFKVINYGNGPTIWGWNGGGGNGIRGYALASGLGVYGESVDNAGVMGRSTNGNGVEGYGGSGDFDFYAGGAGSNYGPFTGSHEVILEENFPREVIPGMIVTVTGKAKTRFKKDGSASLSSTLPMVKLSSVENDKATLGALVSEGPLPKNHWYKAKDGERFAIINALGEGRVWVTNINGEIEAGDYITSSDIPGYGQMQEDDLMHSYTVAKAIETVDWDEVEETVEYEGYQFKIYLIAVVYTSG